MYKHIKRVLDIFVALLGLIVLVPVFLVLILIIKLDSPGPAIFKQKRVMRDNETFTMLKFRTMRADAPRDTPTHMLENADKYLSRVGKMLRKYSLDETIQIIHILSGKMSFIGPRPALWNQHDLISERDKYGANGIRPGITGWAQINGRDELTIEKKAKLDGEYVQNITFFMDFTCFFRTIKNVFLHEGVMEGSTRTVKENISEFETENCKEWARKS